jgi:Fe-S-cluster-containing dehydrogenase component/formate-dependent nitrite reductase membrane component NrfD
MNYGFVIDNRKCIGCHACTTACKSENEVPLGVNRTWVKSVETGRFPDVTRHFQVTRCNHCDNPPCVRICPVTAMYQRDDGIVEFDEAVCIGCKACMQACPYDAIYIDPETNTAAKCHYCAHRVDVGLEPACVVVCPEHAIIAGDMDDPNSEISRMLASEHVTVRKPEQGTIPKLYYINGSDAALRPTAAAPADAFMWADVVAHGSAYWPQSHAAAGSHVRPALAQTRTAHGGAALRAPQPQGGSINGPLRSGESMAQQMVRVTYNAQHHVPWHWPVAAYLVTKGIAAGIMVWFGLLWGLNLVAADGVAAVLGGLASLVFLGITTALLVWDLEKPEMFLTILTRPNWRSWLTRGAFILIAFGLVTTAWWLLEVGAYYELFAIGTVTRTAGLAIAAVLAVGSAIYTAFLFGQAEGRDLWQSTLLPIHLLVQALMAGAAALLCLTPFCAFSDSLVEAVRIGFVASILVDLFVIAFGEFGMPHASEVAARAAHEIRHGKYKTHFWSGSLVVGHIFPLVLAGLAYWSGSGDVLWSVGGLAALVGLYAFEYAFVMAPQEIPNS